MALLFFIFYFLFFIFYFFFGKGRTGSKARIWLMGFFSLFFFFVLGEREGWSISILRRKQAEI